MTTGEKIAALRREKGLSQEALGEKLGLSRQAVSKWEADQAVPTMDNLVELSRLFGVSVDTLLRPDEPLPDKAQPPEGVKLSAEGLKISYAPVLTRKTKRFIIGLAALVLVSVLGNIYAMARVQSLEEQLRVLQAQVQGTESTVQQETVEEDALSDHDIAYDMQYDPNKTVSTTLALSLSARPKELNPDNEIPKFTIQSAWENWTCAAILEQDNSYVGRTEIPMRDAFTVYLTLTDRESGKVRNLLLETVSGVEKEYRLQFDYQWLDAQGDALLDGSAITSENGSTTVRGRLQYRFYNAWSDRFRAYPVKCRLVLREGDTELKSMEMSAAEYNEENGQYYAYGEPDWTVAKSFEKLELVAEVTDNYGRVNEWKIHDFAIEKTVP
ncbi:helix-turn-helix domain-containing protein [Agathobaculum sp. Marseille-P7918]|uniref:helix-turn-helix domain-containing protein n=1 Tax=Agathobaculum sp. Marseille-P7918 TaxID=2479843 RepID=UPI000F63FD50|nr:helix-turn-helix transcriptional regulator [Agathobaculum sp. Marseille-P7918]